MLSKLAKIANRLDSIGLTKEADVLDAFIRKVSNELDGTNYDTETSAPVENYRDIPTQIANEISSGNPAISKDEFKKKFVDSFVDIKAPASSNPSENLLQTIRTNAEVWAEKMWNSPSTSRAAPYPVSTPTGWQAYLGKAGTMGTEVKKAWETYSASGVPGVSPLFSSFTSWYNRNLKGPWGGKHKTPSEVIKLIKSEKSWEVSMADPWGSGSGPAQADRSPSTDTGAFTGVTLAPEERARAIEELNRTKGYGEYAPQR